MFTNEIQTPSTRKELLTTAISGPQRHLLVYLQNIAEANGGIIPQHDEIIGNINQFMNEVKRQWNNEQNGANLAVTYYDSATSPNQDPNSAQLSINGM